LAYTSLARIFTDGLHEALFGAIIQLPPYTPIVENVSFVVKVEVRSNLTGTLQQDWTEYADLLIYGALSAHNASNDPLAVYYFNRALDLWNEAGLWDSATRIDGFYATYKLALLMYAADVLNQAIPFRDELEARIWQFQREDGGIRSLYLDNLTSDSGANSETAGLVLLAYQYKIQKEVRGERALQETIVAAVALLVASLIIIEIKTHRIRKLWHVKITSFDRHCYDLSRVYLGEVKTNA
jgi:hypothetical protein